MSLRSLLSDLRYYRNEIGRMRQEIPTYIISSWSLWKQFWRWRSSLSPNRSPLVDRSPWITLGALDFLSGLLRPTDRVFEWGSGGSTLYLTQRVQEVISVEHDLKWYQDVSRMIEEMGIRNWKGYYQEPVEFNGDRVRDPSDWQAYASTDPSYSGRSFEGYAKVIDNFADESFDVVLVDGRARPSCIHHAVNKIRGGGVLVLDNAERPDYTPSKEELVKAGWTLHMFHGPGPYNRYFWRTEFWTKPIGS